jgi:hypothetical protein
VRSKSFEISAKTEGSITGRNGHFPIAGVSVWSGPTDVKIDGVGRRGSAIRGGLRISHDAMDRIAVEWLRRRGLHKGLGRVTIQKDSMTHSGESEAEMLARERRAFVESVRDDLRAVCSLAATGLEVARAEDHYAEKHGLPAREGDCESVGGEQALARVRGEFGIED